jgi:primosomal protein N' (replication factor Y)
MEPSGPGVEAVEEEVRRLWPRARAAGFDPDRVRTASARAAVLERFAHGRLDILIGSPLLAHQPAASLASLAVLLNPEGILGLTDFRASERLYAEIRRPLRLLDKSDPQAAAVLQTSWPEHFALRAAAAGDYQAFFEEEIFRRRSMGDPPFSSLAEIVLTAADPRALGRAARETAERLRASDARLDVLGPAEASRPATARSAKEALRTVQIIVRADDPALLDEALGRALRDVAIRKSVARAG